MGRISGVSGDRIKIFDVERKTVNNAVRDVDAIRRVEKIRNETAYSSHNYIFESDSFYEHLKKAKKSMEEFSVNEYNLKNQIKRSSNECDDMYEKIVEAVASINNAINSIKVMDSFAGGYGFKKVVTLAAAYSHIGNLGIKFEDSRFVIEERLLKESLISGSMSADIIFDPDSGLLKKIFNILENAKADIVNFMHGSGGLFDKKL